MTIIVLTAAPDLARADAAAVVGEPIFTNPGQIWQLPTEQKTMEHRIRFEGRVNFYDPEWNQIWISCDGEGSYANLAMSPPLLRTGQRVVIEGSLIPSEGLESKRVTVKVLAEFDPVEPLRIGGRIGDRENLQARVVEADGYVFLQRRMTTNHVRLSLVVDNQPATAWIREDLPGESVDWNGRFIRIHGVYNASFDPNQTRLSVELSARSQDVEVLGTMDDAPQFKIARTPISQIHRHASGQEVRIGGHVLSQTAGEQMVIRDETGDVIVHSAQRTVVAPGTQIDAVGRVVLANGQWTLESALFRKAPASQYAAQPPTTPAGILECAEQVRRLSSDEARKRRPVSLTGCVTWSRLDAGFLFLADSTGSVRVHARREQLQAWLKGLSDPFLRDACLQIEGVTRDDGFAPAVELVSYRDRGAMIAPAQQPCSFAQALTGEYDGLYVEMRGLLQRVEPHVDGSRLFLTTPDGDFVAEYLGRKVDASPGAVLRISGVCEVKTDASGRIDGFVVRVPVSTRIAVEQEALSDPFAEALRPIRSLLRSARDRDFTRAHVSGTVLAAIPGGGVFVQEGDAGLLLLSRGQEEPLSRGDRIEAAGMLGWDGIRTVLREAVYRKIGDGDVPAATVLDDPARLAIDLDSRLVRVRGILINRLQQPARPRLTFQTGHTVFDAFLEDGPGDYALGQGLELTGVYRVAFDESRQTRVFQLLVHSPADIRVFAKTPVWTVRRALTFAAVLGGAGLLAVAWITALRRRVHRQTEQIRAQMQRQAELEKGVERASRLEALGVLAGGIAHDFNNLLTVVLGNTSLMMLDEKVMSIAGESLQEIQQGANRARALTHQLLTFAKGGKPVRAVVALSPIIREAAESALRGSNVRCEYDFPADLWHANIDKDQIARAVGNLVQNGAHAMPKGGVLHLALRNETVADGVRPALAPGRYLRLSLVDSGEGIAAEVLPRIFEPYFSTKKTGNGLGLATVHSIAKRHEGTIDVESSIGKGTTFTLWLPASTVPQAAEVVPSRTTTPTMQPLAKPARVLLMDDEPSIRRVGTVLLQRIGLEVVAVCDGAEALREFSAAREAVRPFDLIILDLTIPGGMGGRETIERIRQLDSQVPAIVSSGYSSDPVLADFTAFGFQASVPKPYMVGQLAETVVRLLGTRTQAGGAGRG